jgi:hypothetical protein
LSCRLTRNVLRLVYDPIKCMEMPSRAFESQILRVFYSRTILSADRELQQLLVDCLRKTMHLEKLHAEFLDYHSMHLAHEHHVMTLAYQHGSSSQRWIASSAVIEPY